MDPITADNLEKPINPCAHCRKDAILVCNGCHQARDAFGNEVAKTWYCSPNCQIQDWRKHKAACRLAQDRRSIYRAGRTAQLAFYRYLEQFFDLGIAHVEKKGDDIYLYEGLYDDFDKLPFSWSFFTNEEDKLSALTYLTCGNALGIVHILMEVMIPDILLNIYRIDYAIQNHLRHVVMVSQDGHHNDNTASLHCIIKITLKNAEAYAVDVAGAQYGWYNAVIPWGLYLDSRVERIETVHPLGSVEEWNRKASNKANGVQKTQEEKFGEVVLIAAKLWERANGPFEAMLKSRDVIFERKQAALLNCIEEAVKKHKEEMRITTLPEAEVSQGFNQ